MTSPRVSQRLNAGFRIAWVGLLYVLVASAVLNAFIEKWGFLDDDPRTGLELMLQHQAARPFAYRVLSPFIVNAASRAVPDRLVDRAAPFLLERSPLVAYRHRPAGNWSNPSSLSRGPGTPWSVQQSLHFHVAYVYVFFCLLLVLVLTRRLTADAAPGGPLFADLAPAVGLLFLPLTFHLGGYLYDFAELVLLVAGVLCIVERRLLLFHLVFVLAILNKESNVLMAGYFAAMLYGRLGKRNFAGHVAAQAVTGVVLLALVRYWLRDQPGAGAEFHLWENLRFWASPRAYVGVMHAYAPLIPVPQGLHLATLLLAGFLSFRGWGRASSAVRSLFVVSVAVNAPLMLVLGYRDEIRSLSLIFPAFYLLACHGVQAIYELKPPGRAD